MRRGANHLRRNRQVAKPACRSILDLPRATSPLHEKCTWLDASICSTEDASSVAVSCVGVSLRRELAGVPFPTVIVDATDCNSSRAKLLSVFRPDADFDSEMGRPEYFICCAENNSAKTVELRDIPQYVCVDDTLPRILASPWLLPAERPIGRVGFAPTGDRRLSRHAGLLTCLASVE